MTPLTIGLRKSPHLDELCNSILKHGDRFTSTNNEGADFFLAWGWPQAEQVARENGGQHHKIICVDAHPFALQKGDTSGSRIFQLGNWGALAEYPDWRVRLPPIPLRARENGPVLVLGQVYTALQSAHGLVDVWHTGGYEQWLRSELDKPDRIYRKHPRVWEVENPGEIQPSLAADLERCSMARSWNSTAAVHALLMGYPATAAEAHGWAHLPLDRLAGQAWTPLQIRLGEAWAMYREWLLSRSPRT